MAPPDCTPSWSPRVGKRFQRAKLAEARGAYPNRIGADPFSSTVLTAVAKANATSGCVDERWSAALTVYASMQAKDEHIRQVFASIARDEADHAELSIDVDAFVRERLDDRETRALEDARVQAIQKLEASVLSLPDADPRVAAGLIPPRSERAHLLALVFPELSCAS